MFRKIFERLRGNSLYPRLASPSEIGSALVISPHPDDDVIGMGGTLHLIRDRVSIIQVTSGERGIPDTGPDEAAAVRREESLAAAAVIGLPEDRLACLGFPDGKTGRTGDIARSIKDLLDRHRPDDLFVPSPIDAHPDHKHVARAVSNALGELSRAPRCWIYEVWTPLFADTIIDVSDVVDVKLKAISAHASQTAVIDYGEKILGLNAFRSLSAGGVRYAEAFFVCDPKEYGGLVADLA